MSGRVRQLIARVGRRPDGLESAQRDWLLKDVREDLAAMVDDAENREMTERAAREMLVICALVDWLEGGASPGAEAIGYLEREIKTIPRNASASELTQRRIYLNAIGELGGDDETAGKLWPDGVDERTRPLLDFQGRKLRGRMEELDLTIGELAGRSGIDTVTLVAILFAQEEMRATHWLDLSVALDMPFEWMFEGVRFVPRNSPDGRGFYEIESEGCGSAGPPDAADGLGGDPR